ncbi:hypothetical protein ACX1DX_12175 [Tessaracoccus sp. Y36]
MADEERWRAQLSAEAAARQARQDHEVRLQSLEVNQQVTLSREDHMRTDLAEFIEATNEAIRAAESALDQIQQLIAQERWEEDPDIAQSVRGTGVMRRPMAAAARLMVYSRHVGTEAMSLVRGVQLELGEAVSRFRSRQEPNQYMILELDEALTDFGAKAGDHIWRPVDAADKTAAS